MKKNLKICRIVLLCLFALSIGCSKDDYQLEPQQRNEPRSKVSFEQFKNETGLKDFKTSIQVQVQKNGALNRNADGSYELSDFDIDIDVIKKMQLKQDVSYTFQVHPKGESTEKIYNLVMYYREGRWQTTIVELQPTKKTLDALKLGQKDFFEGGMGVIYESTTTNRSGDCIAFIVDTSNHCPRTGVCEITCDGCSYCVRTTTTLFCFGGDSIGQVYESMQDIPNPHVSGGGGDEPPTTDTDTPTDTDPTLDVPPKKPILIDPVITVDNEALLNAAFISSLLPAQQNWLNANSDAKASILEYLRLNAHSVDSDLFATDLIKAGMNGTAISYAPFFKYPVGSNYATLYPKLTQYLKDVLPTLKYNSFIINKLVQYSELSEAEVVKALTWGEGPTLYIKQLNDSSFCASCDDSTYGLFRTTNPDELNIDIDYVNLLESSTPGAQGNSLSFLLGVTILHEFVHLGDNVDGVDQPGEEGLQFEEATYGESVWLENASDILIKWEH